MSDIIFEHKSYSLTPEETLLECLLRHEVKYPHSCQSGICQACLIKATSGEVSPSWQEGLPETLKAQGYFLACLAKPKIPMQVSTPAHDECEHIANILEMSLLNHNVMQLKLNVDNLDIWTPGQFLNLMNTEGTIRSYSIANMPSIDGFIELHIKLSSNGSMGRWLSNKAKKNSKVILRGPFGRCFYHNPNQLAFDMLLAGTGTGLAPLIAIIKTALKQNHQGEIKLIHGGLTEEDIYYSQELKLMSELFPNFIYDACVLKGQGKYPEESIDKRVLRYLNNPLSTKVYICGPHETVNKLKKQIFLAGVPSQAILSDVFL